jgi:hypothetical protein
MVDLRVAEGLMSVKVGMRTRYCENLASAMISELANWSRKSSENWRNKKSKPTTEGD